MELSTAETLFRDLQEFRKKNHVSDHHTTNPRRHLLYDILKTVRFCKVLKKQKMKKLSRPINHNPKSGSKTKKFYIKYLLLYECAFVNVPSPAMREINGMLGISKNEE